MKTSQSKIKRLKLFSFKLNSLLSITKAINANLSTEDLLERYEKILREELNIGRVLIYKYNYNKEDWEVILKAGCGDEVDEIDMESDILGHEEIAFVTASPNPSLRTFDNIIPVFHNNQPIAYVLIGDIDEETKGVSPTIKHLHFIQTLSNIIIVAIENIRLYNESLQQEALKKELELASRMQSMLIPDKSTLPNDEHIFATSFYKPHHEVGGDYYDYIRLNKEEGVICIADVSGKGISAALLMSNFQANLRALVSANSNLEQIMPRLNERVMSSAKGEKFITLFLAKYNYTTRKLEYITAAHNPPIMYKTQSRELKFLKKGCLGLGMLDEIPTIEKGEETITERTKLLCYTDGLVEVMDETKVHYETDQIKNRLSNSDHIDKNMATIIREQNILEDENSTIFDDISMIGIEFYP
ncbi:MAG: SpoIIE family protein phosphatase [Bacteroidales bacterium]|nr:SpoIIE family protein phosphatase [Bacteroidales bacterium]